MRERISPWNWLLLGGNLVLMMVSLYLVFLWVPMDAEQGNVQRIFYFHVPSAWVAFLAFFVVFLSSVLYLWKGENKWDTLAHSSAEIGVLFTTVALISGSIWAKPIWGIWWTWDARLTTTLVLWLIYVAYLLVRSYAPVAQSSRFAAVVGIVGFVDVPIVFMAIRWWRTQHPEPIFGGGEEAGIAPSMLLTLLLSLAAFTLLYILLMKLRVSSRELEEEVEELKEQAGD